MDFSCLRWVFFSWNCFSYDFNLSDSETALSVCQFQYCLANELEDCPNVPGKVHSILDCNSNVVQVLSTLVNFDNWVQRLVHAIWKGRERSAVTLCMSFVGKNSSSKWNANLSTDHWSAICKEWWAWEQSSVQNTDFPVNCCVASDKVLTVWLLLIYSSAIRLLNLLRSTRRRSFPLGLLCANMGVAYSKKSSTVNNPFLCIRANSTIRSSFKRTGIGRIWLYTAFLSFGVSFTLISVFIPISILCLAKMSWQSLRISSIACSSVSVKKISVQSNCLKNLIQDSVLSCGLNFSFPLSSISFLRLRVCIGVWSSG